MGLGDGYFCEWRFGALKSSWRRMTLEEVGAWERQSGLLPAELGGAIKDEPGQRRQRVDPTRGQAPAPRELGTSGCRSRGCEWLDKPLQLPAR